MSASNPTTLSLCLKASGYFPSRHSNLWDKHLLLMLSPAVSASHGPGSCLSIPVWGSFLFLKCPPATRSLWSFKAQRKCQLFHEGFPHHPCSTFRLEKVDHSLLYSTLHIFITELSIIHYGWCACKSVSICVYYARRHIHFLEGSGYILLIITAAFCTEPRK